MNSYVPRPNTVLPDANIWFSSTLHAWFGLLAAETLGTWHFYWTEDILAEATYHKRKKYPYTNSAQIDEIRGRLMRYMGNNQIKNFPIDQSVSYPDIFDAHVHSAAIHGNIQIIVTDDRKGFVGLYPHPDDYPYEVYTADEFLMLAAESAPQAIDAVICAQHNYYVERRKSFNLAKRLRDAGCTCFADYVAKRMQILF